MYCDWGLVNICPPEKFPIQNTKSQTRKTSESKEDLMRLPTETHFWDGRFFTGWLDLHPTSGRLLSRGVELHFPLNVVLIVVSRWGSSVRLCVCVHACGCCTMACVCVCVWVCVYSVCVCVQCAIVTVKISAQLNPQHIHVVKQSHIWTNRQDFSWDDIPFITDLPSSSSPSCLQNSAVASRMMASPGEKHV